MVKSTRVGKTRPPSPKGAVTSPARNTTARGQAAPVAKPGRKISKAR